MQTEHQKAREQLVTALLEERTFIATPSDFWQSWQLLERMPLSPKRSRAGLLRCGSQSRRRESALLPSSTSMGTARPSMLTR